jgi:hypothetical protein
MRAQYIGLFFLLEFSNILAQQNFAIFQLYSNNKCEGAPSLISYQSTTCTEQPGNLFVKSQCLSNGLSVNIFSDSNCSTPLIGQSTFYSFECSTAVGPTFGNYASGATSCGFSPSSPSGSFVRTGYVDKGQQSTTYHPFKYFF